MVHPLVRDNQRTFRLCQMRDAVLGQYGNIVRSNQLGNSMVDFRIRMVRTSCQNNSALVIFLHIFENFFPFLLHVSAGSAHFIPALLHGISDFSRRNFPEFLNQGITDGVYTLKRHERIAEYNLASADFLHVIFNVLGIGGDNRAVIMVICIFKFVALIEKCRIKNEVYLLMNQPAYMAVCQFCRITFGLTGNGFNTQFIYFPVGAGGEYYPVTQLGKEGIPEGIVLIHI